MTHELPVWLTESLKKLSVERELPKWPILLVRGENVTEEQAREICLRTALIDHFFQMGDEEWKSIVSKLIKFSWDEDGLITYEDYERIIEELDLLDLQYVGNDRVAATRGELPTGWCNWNGEIGTTGTYGDAKWPSLDELNKEWRTVAEAFPFLRMTAQMVTHRDFEKVDDFHPFLTWDIEGGTVTLRKNPGPLLMPVELSYIEPEDYFEGMGRGCSRATLQTAIAEVKLKMMEKK